MIDKIVIIPTEKVKICGASIAPTTTAKQKKQIIKKVKIIMGNLINRSKCRKFALAIAQERSNRFTRVSKSYLDTINQIVRITIEESVKDHPSMGKTIIELNNIIMKGRINYGSRFE